MRSPSLEERHQRRTQRSRSGRAHKITWGDIKALSSQAMTMAPWGNSSPGTLFLLMCAIITCNSQVSIDLVSTLNDFPIMCHTSEKTGPLPLMSYSPMQISTLPVSPMSMFYSSGIVEKDSIGRREPHHRGDTSLLTSVIFLMIAATPTGLHHITTLCPSP